MNIVTARTTVDKQQNKILKIKPAWGHLVLFLKYQESFDLNLPDWTRRVSPRWATIDLLQFPARHPPCTTMLFLAMFHIFAPHLLSYVLVVLSNPEMWKGSLCWTLLGAAPWQRLCLAKWFPAKTLCSQWLKAERKWCSHITAFPGCHVRYPSLICVTVAADQTTQSWHPSPPPHRWSDSGAWSFPGKSGLLGPS